MREVWKADESFAADPEQFGQHTIGPLGGLQGLTQHSVIKCLVRIAILGRISEHGVEVRGGVSYRLSRATLYADAFFRRLVELRADHIETWQPYDVFAQRRLKESFDFIKEIEDRRNFLFTRVQLLLQRNMERETTQSLDSTDRISRIAAIAASTAVGVNMGSAISALAPIWSNILPPTLHDPQVLAQLDGASVGLAFGVALYLVMLRFR